MATKVFLLDSVSEVTIGSATNKVASLIQGSSVVSSDATPTVAGPTSGVQLQKSSTILTWFSRPLQAVTISGTVTFNLWGLESAIQANTGFDVLVERCDQNGNVLSTIIRSEKGTELGTTSSVNNWTGTPTSTSLNEGDRIKITVFGNDAGGNMGNARTFTMNYGAGTGVNGDSYVQFTETLSIGIIAKQNVPGSENVLVSSSIQPAAESGAGIDSCEIGPFALESGAGSDSASISIVESSLFSGVVAAWNLSDLTDSTGRGNTLSNNNGATFVTGLLGNAVSLNGTSQFLSIADNDDVSLGDRNRTIGLWVKWNTFSNRTILSKYLSGDAGDPDAEYDLFWNYSNDGKIRWSVYRPGSSIVTVASNSALSQDNWYCILVWHDADNDLIGISINNDSPNTQATGGPLQASGTKDLRIGAGGDGGAPLGSGFFSGLIDNVVIWNRVLSSNERADFFNAGNGIEFSQSTGASVNENSPGVDSAFINVNLSIPESGVGIDSVLVQNSVVISETGIGPDESSIQSQISASETSTGAESAGTSTNVSSSEVSPGTENVLVTVTPQTASETGVGNDTASSTPTAIASETFPGVEFVVVSPSVFANESFPGSESTSISVSLTISETGAGTDSASAIETGNLIQVDEGSIPDAIASINVSITAGETGPGIDSSSTSTTVPTGETGSGVESALVQPNITVNEPFGSVDVVQVFGNISAGEVGAGTDGVNIQIPGSALAAETGAGTDAVFISVQVISGEIGAGSDIAQGIPTIIVSENATGTEGISLSSSIIVSETVPGFDSILIGVGILIEEGSPGIDFVEILPTIFVGEIGAGFDSITVSGDVFANQLGAGTDNAQSRVFGSLTISGKLRMSVLNSNRTSATIIPSVKRQVTIVDNGRKTCEVVDG